MAEKALTKAEGSWEQHGGSGVTLKTERLPKGVVRLSVDGIEGCEEVELDVHQVRSLVKWLLWDA